MGNVTLAIANGFYQSESLPLSAQRCINYYPSTPQTDTITDANLFGIPGLNQLLTLSDLTYCRGSVVMASVPYFVVGNTLYRILRDYDTASGETLSSEELGSVSGSGPVSIDTNGEQVAIVVPGEAAYIYDEPTELFSEIVDPSFDGPVDTVRFVDSYFVFTTSDGKKFINSPLADGRGLPTGSEYNALDFSTAEADPDQIRGSIQFRNQLHILGSITTEVFSNIARLPAPFERIDGFVMDKGLDARFSLVELHNSYVFIGSGKNESPSVWQFTGSYHTKISTRAIDRLLDELSTEELDVVTAWSYGKDGSFFVGFNLPTTTLVYDSTVGLWHERQSYIDNTATRYRVNGMVDAYNRIIVCDAVDGRIGELRDDIFSEYGDLIRSSVNSQPFDNLGEQTAVYSIEAVAETGVGNSDAEDPKIRLSWSDDGGRKFSNELIRSLGKVGEYERRAVWRRLGTFNRSRVLKLEQSDMARKTIIKVEAYIA